MYCYYDKIFCDGLWFLQVITEASVGRAISSHYCLLLSGNHTVYTKTWWRHQMETCSALPVTGEFPSQKGQWRGALMFSFICAWINGLVKNREACDFRRHRAHFDVIVLIIHAFLLGFVVVWYQSCLPIYFSPGYFIGTEAIMRLPQCQWCDREWYWWIHKLNPIGIMIRWYGDVINWKFFSTFLAFCAGNSPVTGEFPSQRASNTDFYVSMMWVRIRC